MPRGRKPSGDRPLTGAERQDCYRQRHIGNRAAAPPRSSRPIRRSSRAQQWQSAVATILTLQAQHAAWLDALPEAVRDGTTGDALPASVDLDLDELVNIVPPRGFCRD